MKIDIDTSVFNKNRLISTKIHNFANEYIH